MNEYRILNSRKRAIIALIHSVFFLAFAFHGIFNRLTPIDSHSHASAWIMVCVYFLVSGVLLLLTVISRCTRERLYFALCTTSASFGLLRQVFGDADVPVAVPVRIIALGCAVAVGYTILRAYSLVTIAAEL